MTDPAERDELQGELPDQLAEELADDADRRMAELLAKQEVADRSELTKFRGSLLTEASETSTDLLGRLDTLDFVSSVVGEVTDMPERLGDFRITGLLGRGGMGTVFEAWQESLEREVALKVLAPQLASDPAMRQRFRAEARASAALHHQHIVPIFGYGEAQSFLYFAMERVYGVSLDKHIASRRLGHGERLTPQQVARRFAGVADALGHAHKRRILHRDVKPGNILVHPDGTYSLADFGLSKVLGTQSMSVTQGGAFLGTLHYTPPEQALGRELTSASDLYSLGVTMFETLTGELPLVGKTTEAMLESLLHGRPRRLRTVLPDATKDLESVIEKLLHKEPGDRYQDGELLARDLERVAEGEPIRIRRQPLHVRFWRHAKKNPALTAVAAVAFLCALGLVGALTWSQIEHGKTIGLRFVNELQLAVDVAQNEAGPAAGPPGMLEALTGEPVPEAPVKSGVLAHLAAARELLPGEAERADELRDAYLGDPLPAATRLIRAGRGSEAIALLDLKIAELTPMQEDAKRLQLYVLFVSRAVARLTASVALAREARIDLACAQLVRSGATFPKLLMAVLDWAPSRGAGALISELEACTSAGGEPDRRVAMLLLRAFAGLHRRAAGHMMDFTTGYAFRKELDESATRALGEPRESARFCGLEKTLAEVARKAIRALSDAVEFGTWADEGERLVKEQIGPRSPLLAWGALFALLRESRRGSIAAAPDSPGGAELQLRALRLLLELDPPRRLLEDFDPRYSNLVAGASDSDSTAELRALWELQLGSGERAYSQADRWVKEHLDDPYAYLARCRAAVLMGRADQAGLDSVVALQKAADPPRIQAALVAALKAAEEKAGQASEQQKWKQLREELERM